MAPHFRGGYMIVATRPLPRFFNIIGRPRVIHAIVGWRPASKMPNVYVHIGQEQIQKAINESQWGLLLNFHAPNSPISFQGAPQGRYQDSHAN